MEFAVGDKVRVVDPKWWRDGTIGEVIKVNRVTLRMRVQRAGHHLRRQGLLREGARVSSYDGKKV